MCKLQCRRVAMKERRRINLKKEEKLPMMKHVADMTEKLQDLHKKMKDLDEEIKGPKNITNNAMFVGSTTELQKMLKQMGGGKR